MFIGHFALGFAAKKWAPRQSLAVLLIAPSFVDVLWPLFCALGIESFHIQPGNSAYQPLVFDSYPWSHSLLMGIVWGALFGAVVYALSKDRAGAIVTGLLVVSHWVLDFVSHVPDMPLWPGGPKLGLGLWNSIPATIVVEGLLFVAGVAIYLRATRARDRIGYFGIRAYILFLAVLYAASSNGAPPPSARIVIIVGLLAPAVFTPVAWWADRHREVVA
jgi:membrane-bound metal-dependent hydrolase YbcI (DUF457 family)